MSASNNRTLFLILVAALLLGGCAPGAPHGPAPALPIAAETLFSIANPEPAGGLAGAPPPDWLAWGAQAFTAAPDGSFWILDAAAAHLPRLLHYSGEGALLGTVLLEGLVAGAVDVAVSQDSLWVLGTGSQPAVVARLELDGAPAAEYAVPEALFEAEGMYVANLLDDLRLGENGEVLLKGPAGPALYEFLDSGGRATARLLEGYASGGSLYRIEGDRLLVDGRAAVIGPAAGGRVLWADLVGVRPDGGVYVAVVEEVGGGGEAAAYPRTIHAYSQSGELLGLALPPESAVPAASNRDLALGPDGALYALVSRPDHSVDVLRLGFAAGLTPPAAESPTATPTALSPLLPEWATPPPGAAGLEIARNTLLRFFTALHAGEYEQAAGLYGGTLDMVADYSPDASPAELARTWQEACFLLQCLQVARIAAEEETAPGEFRFVVEFMWGDGTLFRLGPCCGASEADMPPVWQFPYTVREIEGRWQVMEPPVYVP